MSAGGSVTLLLGRAGSGKSAAVIERLRAHAARGERALLIVPEQFTFETERRLSHALGGLMGIQVLSLERLSERVLDARGQAAPFLSQQGLCMVVRRAAMKNRDALQAFGPVAASRGFAARMAELQTRLKRACITPEQLAGAVSRLPSGSALAAKLADAALLYRETEAYLTDRYLSRDDALTCALSLLPDSFAADLPVYMDGLERATAQQYLLIDALMRCCPSFTATLLLDPDEGADAEAFAPNARAYDRLCALARKNGRRVLTLPLRGGTRAPAPALTHLERELFAQPGRVYPSNAPELTVYGASSRAREAEAVADEILTLARAGVRYRDVAVMASDMNAYAFLLTRAFESRGIPVFVDARRPVRRHAAADFLLVSLSACAKGFPAFDVLRAAKSGYATADAADVEELDNYLLRTGLTGGALTKPFTGRNVPEAAERARAALMEPLCALRERTSGGTASDKARAAYEYLLACGVDERLKESVETLSGEGRQSLAAEHAQVWNALTALISQLDAILCDLPMSRADFLQLLEEGLEGGSVGVVPGMADQVLLGDVNRTRSRKVKALFVVGANEGLLPPARPDDALLNDRELALLAETGLEPWEDSALTASLDRLDLYGALTRAETALFVTYTFTAGGQELAPAPLVARLNRLFPRCRRASDLTGSDALPACLSGAVDTYADALSRWKDDGTCTPQLSALDVYLYGVPGMGERVLRMRAAGLEDPEAPLGPALSRKLYAGRLTMSASRLEQYNACPFRHFARYGLGAQERDEYREKPGDLGSFYHAALDGFVRLVLEGGLNFASITDADADSLLDALLPPLFEGHNDGFLLKNDRWNAMRFLLERTVRQSVRALLSHVRAGGFVPVRSETRFGDDCVFPPLRIRLADGTEARLTGVIDRVDAAGGEKDEPPLTRIVDYKTHGRAFDFAGVLHGLTLQLPLYLAAATAGGETPAGMYYMPLDVPPPEEGESVEDAVRRAFLLRGLTLSDARVTVATDAGLAQKTSVVFGLKLAEGEAAGPVCSAAQMRHLIQAARARAAQTVADMLAGGVAASPVAGSCTYCAYKSACRFDPTLPACRARKVEKLSADAFFALTGGAHAVDK